MFGISPRFSSLQARMPAWVSFSHGVSTQYLSPYVLSRSPLPYSMSHTGGEENIADQLPRLLISSSRA